MRTLEDLDAADAAVGVRVDVNSPMDGADLLDDARLRAHVDTLSELAARDARVAVLAHQGRPGGEEFAPLATHADHLDDLLEAPVDYVDATFSTAARQRLRDLTPGTVLVLENTRFYSEEYMEFPPERAADTHLVTELAPALDAFVNDAFACAHRSQPSIVGFPERVPTYAGRVMARELDALGAFETTPTPRVYALGGAKVADGLRVAERVLERGLADAIVTSGVVGNTLLSAAGVDLGAASEQVIEERAGADRDRAGDLLDTYGDRIHCPRDVAVERDGERTIVDVAELPVAVPAEDVGPATVAAYAELFADAGTVALNGPAGVYEDDRFATGTRELFTAARRAEYTVLGGGDTAAACRRLGLAGFDHVSTGGSAALTLLSGGDLPGVEALKRHDGTDSTSEGATDADTEPETGTVDGGR